VTDILAGARLLSQGQKHLPGIYGGVGPLAHVTFEQQLLACRHRRGARTDQDYPVWLVANVASTPNRMASLSGEGPAALPYLLRYARLLQDAGSDFLVVVCNTAHAYHAEVQRELRIPWVHLMEITVSHIRRRLEGVERAGVIGTDGTIQTGLYRHALEARGLEEVAPAVGSPEQAAVMEAIFHPEWGIKATGAEVSPRARRQLRDVADWARDRGAQAMIAACTEVSVALTPDVYPVLPVVDPLAVAAEVVIDLAYGEREPREFFATP
jgi:aspartate racemase